MTHFKTFGIGTIIALLFFVAGLFRLNDLSLYTDSTRYLIWGNSIAEFRGFVDATQPIPSRFVMNAPLYPVLLAPVLAVAPLSVTAAKVWTLLWGSAALVLFFVWLRRHFNEYTAAAGTLVLAANALFFVASTEILSEAPFVAFVLALFLAFETFQENPDNGKAKWVFLAAIALVTLLREVGAALVLASLVVFFQKKEGKNLVVTAGSAALLYLLWMLRTVLIAQPDAAGQMSNLQYLMQHFVTDPGDSLIAEFLIRSWLNFRGYVLQIGGLLFYPFPESLIATPTALFEGIQSVLQSSRVVIGITIAAGAFYGASLDGKSSPAGRLRSLSLLLMFVIILLYPVHDMRFLLPTMPIILFFVLKAFAALKGKLLTARAGTITGFTLAAIVILPNLVAVAEIIRTNIGYRSDPAGFGRTVKQSSSTYFGQPWQLLGEWLAGNTPEDAVVACPAKELAPFLGSRKLLETSRVLPTPVFERFLRDFDAKYLVTTSVFDGYETYRIAMEESRRLWFTPLASFANITVYEIRSAILTPPPQSMPVVDTTKAGGHLLLGRRALQRLQYGKALSHFSRACQLAPNQPEPQFQLLTGLSFTGDSGATMKAYEQLFTIPQSTAYAQIAESVVSTMNQMLLASRQKEAFQYAFAAFEGGLSYWGLGFPHMALGVMNRIVRADSTNFVGALWGVHIAKQVGDTALSNKFLERLKAIDITAPIVADWMNLRSYEEALRKARGREDRIRLHTKIAGVYTKLELFDDAMDSLERAFREDPSNIDVLLSLADVLEKKKARWGAYRIYQEVLKREPHNSFAKEKCDSLIVDL